MGVVIKNEVLEKNKLTAFISGELDHHTAKAIRQEIDINIEKLKPKNLYLDFSRVDFMDSSGIGLVMGRYKLQGEHDGLVYIQNPPPLIKRVMLVAGINKLARIVSVEAEIDAGDKDDIKAKINDLKNKVTEEDKDNAEKEKKNN